MSNPVENNLQIFSKALIEYNSYVKFATMLVRDKILDKSVRTKQIFDNIALTIIKFQSIEKQYCFTRNVVVFFQILLRSELSIISRYQLLSLKQSRNNIVFTRNVVSFQILTQKCYTE